MALGTVVIALLVAAGFGLRAYVHRNRRAAR